KQTLGGGPGQPPYVFRQRVNLQPAPSSYTDGLNTYIRMSHPYPLIRNIRVTIPGDDPDSTKITSDSMLSRLAGARSIRFMVGSEGIGSSVATYAQARKAADFGCDCQRADTVQVSSCTAIAGGAVQWN